MLDEFQDIRAWQQMSGSTVSDSLDGLEGHFTRLEWWQGEYIDFSISIY